MPELVITQSVRVTIDKAWSRPELEYLAEDLRSVLASAVIEDTTENDWTAVMVEELRTGVTQVDMAQAPPSRYTKVELLAAPAAGRAAA